MTPPEREVGDRITDEAVKLIADMAIEEGTRCLDVMVVIHLEDTPAIDGQRDTALDLRLNSPLEAAATNMLPMIVGAFTVHAEGGGQSMN